MTFKDIFLGNNSIKVTLISEKMLVYFMTTSHISLFLHKVFDASWALCASLQTSIFVFHHIGNMLHDIIMTELSCFAFLPRKTKSFFDFFIPFYSSLESFCIEKVEGYIAENLNWKIQKAHRRKELVFSNPMKHFYLRIKQSKHQLLAP